MSKTRFESLGKRILWMEWGSTICTPAEMQKMLNEEYGEHYSLSYVRDVLRRLYLEGKLEHVYLSHEVIYGRVKA